MSAKRPKSPSFTTPKGVFVWPKLTEPDFKFKKEGEFSVKLRLPLAEAKPLINKLAPLHAQAEAEGKAKLAEIPVANRKKMEAKGTKFTVNPFYSSVYDEDGNETGEVEFKFTMTHSGQYKSGPKAGQKWPRKPGVFDAKGKPVPSSTQIWGGSIGKVAFEAAPYWVAGQLTCGLSLRLQAAQIIELVQGGQRSASSFGFGQEEGFEAAEETTTESSEGFTDETQADAAGEEPVDF